MFAILKLRNENRETTNCEGNNGYRSGGQSIDFPAIFNRPTKIQGKIEKVNK